MFTSLFLLVCWLIISAQEELCQGQSRTRVVNEEAPRARARFEISIQAIEQKLRRARTGNSLWNPQSFYRRFAHGWNRCEGPLFWGKRFPRHLEGASCINGRLTF